MPVANVPGTLHLLGVLGWPPPSQPLTFPAVPAVVQPPQGTVKSYTLIDFSELDATSQLPPDPWEDEEAASRHSSTTSTCLLEEELMSLGLCAMPLLL